MAGERPIIENVDRILRKYGYVKDITKMFMMITEYHRVLHPQIINYYVRDAESVCTLDLVKRLIRVLVKTELAPIVETLSNPINRKREKPHATAVEIIGWEPEIKLSKGLTKNLEWHRRHLSNLKLVSAGAKQMVSHTIMISRQVIRYQN